MTVLIVDDDRDLREVLALAATFHGYEVRLATDGDDALARQRVDPADAVIVDLHMARVGGLDTIAELRRQFPSLPIMAMSGDDDSLDVARAQGASAVFKKPFDIDMLMSTVRPLVGDTSD